jgi:hypothetical protein
MNFLEEKTNNSDAKKRYKEITKYIDNKNPEIILKINEAQDKTDKEINKMNKEMISKNVDLDEINATTWDYEMADPRVEINNCKNDRNDLNCHRYTDTYRYIKRTELEQQEDNYLASLELSVGDIKDIADMKQKRNNKEYDMILETIENLPKEYKEEIKQVLADKNNVSHEKLLEVIPIKKQITNQ